MQRSSTQAAHDYIETLKRFPRITSRRRHPGTPIPRYSLTHERTRRGIDGSVVGDAAAVGCALTIPLIVGFVGGALLVIALVGYALFRFLASMTIGV